MTRRSTLLWSLVGLASYLVMLLEGWPASGSLSAPEAVTLAVFTVSNGVALFDGFWLSIRARSRLWILAEIVLLPVVPLGAILAAMMCPESPGQPGPFSTRGTRRPPR